MGFRWSGVQIPLPDQLEPISAKWQRHTEPRRLSRTGVMKSTEREGPEPAAPPARNRPASWRTRMLSARHLSRFPAILILSALSEAPPTFGPAQPPSIAPITVCSPTSKGGAGSCPQGTFDTQQIVLGPDGDSVNGSARIPIPHDHSSAFAPPPPPLHPRSPSLP